MWNDTVRKQSESSFITGDINSSASLNRGNYKLFFISLTLVLALKSRKCVASFPAPSYLPQIALDPVLPQKKSHSDNWKEEFWWLLPFFPFLYFYTCIFKNCNL